MEYRKKLEVKIIAYVDNIPVDLIKKSFETRPTQEQIDALVNSSGFPLSDIRIYQRSYLTVKNYKP